ncbi:MAG TPA: cyclase family protein [Geobacteraceae bacterium]
MQIFDITVSLSDETPVFPGDPPVVLDAVTSLKRGDAANVSRLSLSTHAGTPIDAPRHYDNRGQSVDNIPLSLLVGEALVADLHGVRQIGPEHLASFPLDGVERLLLKTDNSALWNHKGFFEDYAALTGDGAQYLIKQGIQLVGIDYLSIEPFAGDGRVHRQLLAAGVALLEGVDLAGVPAGRYELICLPLKIKEGDGAPVRAILRRRSAGGGEATFDPHTTKWPLA